MLSTEERNIPRYLSGETDIFVGRRSRVRRYLVCSLQGFFPVLVKTGAQSLAVIYRTGAPHVGASGTLAVSASGDGGVSWSDPVEVQPRWDDNRNPAFGVNAKDELVAAFWKARLHNYEADPQGRGLVYTGGERESWKTVPALNICKSADGGRTWRCLDPYMSRLLSLASPYGRIIASPDGTLLMPIYGAPRGLLREHAISRFCCAAETAEKPGATRPWWPEATTKPLMPSYRVAGSWPLLAPRAGMWLHSTAMIWAAPGPYRSR
jgi:hypothetical protein